MHHNTCFGIIRQLLIGMQLLTDTSSHFFMYNMTSVNCHVIANLIDALVILFACLVIDNLHYYLFAKLVESFSLFPISDIRKDFIVSTNYR